MRKFAWQYIFLLTLVIACGCANAGSIAKRDADNGNFISRFYNGLISYAFAIPYIGSYIAGFFLYCQRLYIVSAILLDEVFARLAGGGYPCTISLQGTQCTPLTNNGGVSSLVIDLINQLPPILLPEIGKKAFRTLINLFIIPIVDVLLGGISKSARTMM